MISIKGVVVLKKTNDHIVSVASKVYQQIWHAETYGLLFGKTTGKMVFRMGCEIKLSITKVVTAEDILQMPPTLGRTSH